MTVRDAASKAEKMMDEFSVEHTDTYGVYP